MNNKECRTAMIDVNAIIGNGPHSQQAAQYVQEAQTIFQYNLQVIENILRGYKNKEQAHAYFMEAARQLQIQLNNSKVLMTQALLNGLNSVIEGQKSAYSLIIRKDALIYVEEGDGDDASKFSAMPEDITVKIQAMFAKVTVTTPPLPSKVDTPNLPADLGEGVPFRPQPAQAPTADDIADSNQH